MTKKFRDHHQKTKHPLISVIIPQYRKPELTIQCIKSLQKWLIPSRNIEVIVVDDASPDDSAFIVSQACPNVRVVKNPKNYGFAKTCNHGASIAMGEWLIFLNNDTISTMDWISPMLQAAMQPNVGLVGAKLLFPNGTIQHAGVWFSAEHPLPIAPFHRYYEEPSDLPEANQSGPISAVTGACILINRDYFWTLQGFDEEYYMSLEDIDLCLKVHSTGKIIWYESQAELIHLETQSDKTKRHRDENRNWLRLNKKWLQTSIFSTPLDTLTMPHDRSLNMVVSSKDGIVDTVQSIRSLKGIMSNVDRLIFLDYGLDDGSSEFIRNVIRSNSLDTHIIDANLSISDRSQISSRLMQTILPHRPIVMWSGNKTSKTHIRIVNDLRSQKEVQLVAL
ncbi:MAG: hypothetical protein C7B47_03075 [Sulfobacillus thermosulfidooxidans]|uniref:Glycosyltransferase 2-like domain-containing protein n=1 Tax=Sulfobacillus thermosulfidooxidans TaxID=28034 RepID=A0A2T2X384_SULTH|nr:MAG: hypothetical protein C7B47_03075 [Sulfobacillus thermosulfidooxidans]